MFGSSGPTVTDQTPAASRVIFSGVLGAGRVHSPDTVTALALGARRRRVTRPSGCTSGETSVSAAAGGAGAAGAAGAAGGGCAAAGAVAIRRTIGKATASGHRQQDCMPRAGCRGQRNPTSPGGCRARRGPRVEAGGSSMQDLSRAIAAIREQARPLVGSRDDCDPLVQAAARGPAGAAGRGVARQPRVLPAAGGDHPAADRGARLSRGGGGGGLAGRLPGEPLRARRRPPASTARRCRRWRAFAASRPGCGATPTCWTSSAGCASTTTGGRPRRAWASTAWTSTACTRPSPRWSATWRASIPAAAARARRRYACFDHFGYDSDTYAQAMFAGLRESCEDEVVAQLVELQRRAGGGRSRRRRRRRTTCSTPSRTPASP